MVIRLKKARVFIHQYDDSEVFAYEGEVAIREYYVQVTVQDEESAVGFNVFLPHSEVRLIDTIGCE